MPVTKSHLTGYTTVTQTTTNIHFVLTCGYPQHLQQPKHNRYWFWIISNFSRLWQTFNFFRWDIPVVHCSTANGKVYFCPTQIYYINHLREQGCPDYTNYYNHIQWRTQEFFFGRGGFHKFCWGQRERGSGGGSPIVRGSGGSCNLVQETSFHIVKFS
jgi:hypothetical protein